MVTFRKDFLFIFIVPLGVDAHGYLKSPRSRNWVAKEDGKWSGGNMYTPEVETCPHCLNLNSNTCGKTGGHDYDYHLNALGGPMPKNIQAVYTQGQEIDLTVVLTAHHKGHFEYKACAINEGELATQACFDANPLRFVQDILYPNAPVDSNYPERAYIPLASSSTYKDTSGSYMYTHKYELPANLSGDLVLIQWHYITGNSCVAPGYSDVSFPSAFDPGNLGTCSKISSDGNGTPEQFWNCAEVRIQSGGPVSPPATTPINPPVPAPVSTPTRSPTLPNPTKSPTPPPTYANAPTKSPVQGGICPNEPGLALIPTSGCTGFFYCEDGSLKDANPTLCPSGLLFDKELRACNWPQLFTCES